MSKIIISAQQLENIYGKSGLSIQNEVNNSQQQTQQPVKQEDGILKSIVKAPINTLLVRPAQRTTEALYRTIAPESLAAKGYEAFADEGGQQLSTIVGDYTVPTATTKMQVLGEGLDAASYAIPVGRIAGATGKVATKIASKIAQPKNAEIAGKVLGNALGFGTAGYTSDVGQNLIEGDTLPEALKPGMATAVSAALPVVGAGLGRIANSKLITTPAEKLKKEAVEKGIKSISERVGSVDNTLKDTTYTYIDNAGTERIISPVDTFSKYKLSPQVNNGVVNVDNIYKTIDSNISMIDSEIDNVLTESGKTYSIDEFASILKKEASQNPNIKRSGKVQETIRGIENRVDDWKLSYGDSLSTSEINEIRKVANENFKKERIDIDRIIGNGGREVVYNTTDDKVVRDLLNEQRALINAETFADRLKGKAVKGGRLGNSFSSITGAMIGNTIDKNNGSFIGTLIGSFGGRSLSEFLQSRTFRSLPADIKSAIEKRYLKSPNTKDTKMTDKIIANISSIISNNTKTGEFIPKQFPGDYLMNKVNKK